MRFGEKSGPEWVQLSADGETSALELNDSNGRPRLRLSATDDGGMIEFLDDTGRVTKTVR